MGEPMSYKILIVDDEPDNVDVLAIFLGHSGYQVLTATNGRECLAVAEAERPDLILLDIMMPVMDGYEACAAMREQAVTSDIPVLFLSARAEQVDMDRGLALGASGYVTKPYSFKHLLGLIREVLE